jgi:hypothetical protein
MSLGNILPMMGDKNKQVSTPTLVGIKTRRGDEKFKEIMHRWGQGKLHAGPGDKHLAQSQEQAIAIAYSMAEDK